MIKSENPEMAEEIQKMLWEIGVGWSWDSECKFKYLDAEGFHIVDWRYLYFTGKWDLSLARYEVIETCHVYTLDMLRAKVNEIKVKQTKERIKEFKTIEL